MSDVPWRPSRAVTVLVGLLSIWPFIYMGLFIGFMSRAMVFSRGAGIPDAFKFIMALHLLTMLLMFALTAVYIVHVFRTDIVPGDKKVLWVVVLFLGNMIAFPIYWYLYWWRPLRVTPA